MIKVFVEKYCHHCPEFSPEISKLYANDRPVAQHIYCAHTDKCANIYKFLKDEVEKEFKKGNNP